MKTFFISIILSLILVGCFKQKTQPLYYLVLNDQGVNTINATTPFNISFIAPKLLGYDLELFSSFEAGNAQSIIQVTYEGQNVMLLLPSHATRTEDRLIKSIIVNGKYVTNPLGIELGETLVYDKFDTCQERSDTMVCSQKEYSNLYALYTKVNQDLFTLKEIIWTQDSASIR